MPLDQGQSVEKEVVLCYLCTLKAETMLDLFFIVPKTKHIHGCQSFAKDFADLGYHHPDLQQVNDTCDAFTLNKLAMKK
jgi:hypothetical protein